MHLGFFLLKRKKEKKKKKKKEKQFLCDNEGKFLGLVWITFTIIFQVIIVFVFFSGLVWTIMILLYIQKKNLKNVGKKAVVDINANWCFMRQINSVQLSSTTIVNKLLLNGKKLIINTK